MIIVKLTDKRRTYGYSIKFFHTDVVTPEIYLFVKKRPNAYIIDGKDVHYYNERDAFLRDYAYLLNKVPAEQPQEMPSEKQNGQLYKRSNCK